MIKSWLFLFSACLAPFLLTGCWVIATRDYEGKLRPVFDPVNSLASGAAGDATEAMLYGVPAVGIVLGGAFKVWRSFQNAQATIQVQEEAMEKLVVEPDEKQCLRIIADTKKKKSK